MSDNKLNENDGVAPEIEEGSAIVKGNRTSLSDHYVKRDITESSEYKYHDFLRLNATDIKFTKVNFEHCTFDSSYFNNCVFDSCTFTGCRFISCNFHRTSLIDCNFKYASFDKTLIDPDILEREAPLEENLRMHFARTLRMNYQQTGNAKAVNTAISLELKTTAVYLFKSWSSSETYYHKKYTGLKRLGQMFKWLEFVILDFIWGNGESIFKLLRSLFMIIVAICIYNTFSYADSNSIHDYYDSFIPAAANFFGYNYPKDYPNAIIAVIAACKLVFFALFTTILVKRFSRR